MTGWTDDFDWANEWETIDDLPGGGQGTVKQVRKRNTGEIAFLKLLSRQRDEERRSRFFREATAYETCNHPNMPRLIQSNAHHHKNISYKLFIVTEFVSGETLSAGIKRDGPTSIESAVAALCELLSVVEYLHEEGWIHRDIKPDNIVLREANIRRPVLVDFGLGYRDGLVESFQTEHGQELGNRFLRLPELASGSPLKQDIRTDIAFLGGILYYMLTGLAPDTLMDAQGRMPHQRTEVVAQLRVVSGLAINRLLGLFDRCFAYKLTDRYASISEFRTSVTAVIAENDGSVSMEPEDVMGSILEKINSQANQRIAKLKSVYDAGMSQISAVHRKIAPQVSPAFVSHQSGHVNFMEGLRNRLGFSHFATHAHKFAPEFLIKSLGEEIVVYVDGEIVHRTDFDAPVFDEAFQAKIHNIYLKGLNDLLSKPMPEA